MASESSILQKRRTAWLLLVLGVVLLLFYVLTFYAIKDVYAYPVMGAAFELLSFPMLIGLVALPVALIMATLKGPRNLRIYYVATGVLWLVTVLLLCLS